MRSNLVECLVLQIHHRDYRRVGRVSCYVFDKLLHRGDVVLLHLRVIAVQACEVEACRVVLSEQHKVDFLMAGRDYGQGVIEVGKSLTVVTAESGSCVKAGEQLVEADKHSLERT